MVLRVILAKDENRRDILIGIEFVLIGTIIEQPRERIGDNRRNTSLRLIVSSL